MLISVHNALEKVGNAAIGLPSTLIRHENGAFRSSHDNRDFSDRVFLEHKISDVVKREDIDAFLE